MPASAFFYRDPFTNDYLFPGLSLGFGASPPDLETFRGNIQQRAFVGTGALTEEAFFNIHILHDLKAATNPSFHCHWGHIIESPSGNVKWQIEVTYANGYADGTYPAPTTLSSTQAAPAQYAQQLTDDDDMVLADTVEPDGVALCRIFRDPADPADTFENDAFLFFVDMHYRKGQIATNERNRPFLSAGFGS